MNPAQVSALLHSSLEHFWAEVSDLSVEDARAVLDKCALACVREDFRAKFLRELNSRRAIAARFFYEAAELDPTSRLEAVLGFTPTLVTACVVWGSFDDPVGFRVRGTAESVHELFVQQGDAVGYLSAGHRSVWLFLAGTSESLWRLRVRSEHS